MNEMADIEAIKLLKARYFRCLDTQDWAGWRACMTDDLEARFDDSVTAPGETETSGLLVSGADELVRLISGNLKGATTVHHGHTPEIALTGRDTATGIWAMVDMLRIPGAPDMRGYGHYHEHYRRQDGAWRIARLHVTRLRMDRG
ncbi:MAG TPA: nuclear transport factor 2 family protein [Novosphingobium sp.]|nr:nuclear transport factor 2 family protein [Novosphingobium sp.]